MPQHELDILVRDLAHKYSLSDVQVRYIMHRFAKLAQDKIEERVGFHSENARRAAAVLEEFFS